MKELIQKRLATSNPTEVVGWLCAKYPINRVTRSKGVSNHSEIMLTVLEFNSGESMYCLVIREHADPTLYTWTLYRAE